MTLLWWDGFAHGQMTARYGNTNAQTASTLTSTPRTSGLYYAKGPFSRSLLATPSADVTVGLGVRAANLVSSEPQIRFYGDWTGSNGTLHVTVWMNSSGKLEARRNGTTGTLLATGTTTLSTGTWYYLEARVTVADSGGRVQVWLNGSLEIDFTGDTKNAGTASTITAVYVNNTTGNTLSSDFYVLNNEGTVNNSRFGDSIVYPLVPNGAGASSGLAPTGSVTNWQNVDELPGSGSDYNASTTVGAKDTYALSDVDGSVQQVLGVRVNTLMVKIGAGTGNAQIVTRLSGVDYTTAARALTTSTAEYSDSYQTSIATGEAWTPSEVNGMQAGALVASGSDGSTTIRLSALHVEALTSTAAPSGGGSLTLQARGWGIIRT